MPYDGQAGERPERDDPNPGSPKHSRGALRPPKLTSVRTRLNGDAIAWSVRLTDMALLALLAWISASATPPPLRPALVGGSVLAAGMLIAFNTYQFRAKEAFTEHLHKVLGAAGASSLAGLAASRLFLGGVFDGALVGWCLQVAALTSLSHATWYLVIRQLRRRTMLTPNLVIVGASPGAERLVRQALRTREAHILGIFDDRKSRAPRDIFGVPVLGGTADLNDHRILPYVDRIVLAVPNKATARIADLLERLAPIPNPISLLLEELETDADWRTANGGIRVLDAPLSELSGAKAQWTKAAVKRATDVILASLALIALAPVLIVIALAIWVDSPGPVFFRQRRHGLLNEEVVVWKFRTMRVEAEDPHSRRQVGLNDDRITRVGRVLRRTSLDELPQLLNVLRGEMSLVGPRPHAIGMLTGQEESHRLVETYAHRHRIKPGLTGWAAINGSRGPVDSAEAVRRRVSLDVEYIERQSIWLDLAIMLRTLPCLLGDKEVVR